MLIIFDCDGVLVDSEWLAARVFSEALRTVDIELSQAECYRAFHGRTLATCFAWIEENKNVVLPGGFSDFLHRETKKKFSLELRPVDGVRSIISFLELRKLAFCVASNGGHEKISCSLRTTNLLSHFPYRYSAEDVVRGKPYPDLFVYAAQQMGCAPRAAVVIEDSLTGYTAACAAGMQAVVFNPDSKEEFAAIDSHRSMASILRAIRSIVC